MSQSFATTSQADVTESIIFPPGDIYSDEPPLVSDLHREQIDLLIRLIKWWWRDRQDFYATDNLRIYFSTAVASTGETPFLLQQANHQLDRNENGLKDWHKAFNSIENCYIST